MDERYRNTRIKFFKEYHEKQTEVLYLLKLYWGGGAKNRNLHLVNTINTVKVSSFLLGISK